MPCLINLLNVKTKLLNVW